MPELVRGRGPEPGVQVSAVLIGVSSLDLFENRLFQNTWHPERSEGPWFLRAHTMSPARENTQIPRFARDDSSYLTSSSPRLTTVLSYNFARSMLITSSEVMTPVSLLCSSTTGRVSRLYLSNSSATSFSATPSWARTSGSWVSESMGVEGWASTSLARGTAPTRVPRES